MNTQSPAYHQFSFDMFAACQGEFETAIADANSRLAKAGLPPVSYTIANDGVVDKIGREMVTVCMDRLLPHYEGYSLVSRLDFFDGQVLVSTVPGRETPAEFRVPDSRRCDHCNIAHGRTRAYVIEGPDGFVQIGSSCLRKYLPSSALALIDAEWIVDLVNEMVEQYNDDDHYYTGGRQAYDLNVVVRLALRIIANSGWVSSKMAAERGIPSTANLVRDAFGLTGHRLQEWKEDNPKQSKYDPAVVIDYCKTMPGTSDYAFNIRTLAGMSHIPWKMIGFVASMPSAYIRHIEEVADRQVKVRQPAPTGRVQVTGTVISFKDYESQWGVTTKVLLECDGDWRLFVTLPSSLYELEVGDRCTMTVTVTPDDNDPSFARGNRPTKGKIIQGGN